MGNFQNQFPMGYPMDPNFIMAQNYGQMYYSKMM